MATKNNPPKVNVDINVREAGYDKHLNRYFKEGYDSLYQFKQNKLEPAILNEISDFIPSASDQIEEETGFSPAEIERAVATNTPNYKWIDDELGEATNVTALLSPSAFVDAGSKWTDETNAYTFDDNFAYPTQKLQIIQYYGYNGTVPGGATVDNIVLYLTCASVDGTGQAHLKFIQVSWDGGSTWSNPEIGAAPSPIGSAWFSPTKQTYLVGADYGDWGHTWTVAEINSNTNFRIRFQAEYQAADVPQIYHAGVKIYYTP